MSFIKFLMHKKGKENNGFGICGTYTNVNYMYVFVNLLLQNVTYNVLQSHQTKRMTYKSEMP